MKYDYNVIVIGAGSAGLVAAAGCAELGAKVALIEKNRMGGECLNTGCVPSKTFLSSSHLASDIKKAKEFGLNVVFESSELDIIMKRVATVISEIEENDSQERFVKMGVDVIRAHAMLIDKHTVSAGNRTITAKNIVIATGAVPMIPPIEGLEEVEVLTNENIFKLKTLPEKLIVLGTGPIAMELGQGFAHLGSKVSIVGRSKGIFKKDDAEVGPLMEDILRKDGVDLITGFKVKTVKKTGGRIKVMLKNEDDELELDADELLIAMGKKTDTGSLGLESAAIELDESGFIKTDQMMRTTCKNIFACGDVAGPYQFTHMAGYQAGIIIRNIIFRMRAKADYSKVSWSTFTSPEVAHAGLTEQMAIEAGKYVRHVLIPLEKMDRAKADNHRKGFLKLIVGSKNRVIGATVVGPKAGEMISLASLAISKKIKTAEFAELIFPYPTESEIFKAASLEFAKADFKPWQKKLVKTIFLR